MIIIDYNTGETLQDKLWQYDYGETLRIQGGSLQKAQEIHFSLTGRGGNSITRIGVTKDNVTDVVIPDSMLENNDSEINYLIYVFLYNRDSTSGETTKRFVLNVRSRPKPEHAGGADGNAFGEVVEEVRKSAERAEAAETKAKEYETQTKADAAQTALDREKVKEMVDTVSNISAQVETVKNYAAQAQEASTNALQAQAGAETAEGMAEQHALEVAGNKAEVERMTTQVREDKTSVEQKVQNFNGTVAEEISTVRQTGIQETKKVTDEGTKQVKAVADKGAEVLQSIPEFPTSLPNPNKLTFNGAVTAEYDGSGAVTVTIPKGVDTKTERIEKLATDTEVELEPNKLYIFPKMVNLTYTLKEPTDKNVANEYHFVFQSGENPTQVVHPLGIKAGNFNVQANRIYEVSIMENLLTSQSWEVV